MHGYHRNTGSGSFFSKPWDGQLTHLAFLCISGRNGGFTLLMFFQGVVRRPLLRAPAQGSEGPSRVGGGPLGGLTFSGSLGPCPPPPVLLQFSRE